jgi:ATP-dependent exoDNAse (exonuclease V) beta subunit
MTVHKAKGLEFPVVILADITAKLAQRDPDRYIDPASNLCVLKLAGWMPVELREHAPLEALRDEAEGVRLAYVAATRARDLLVIPAVGDKPWEEGWLRPLNRAIYPRADRRRDQRSAPGCPAFKSKDTVLQRPDDEPASQETVCPGLHEFAGEAGAPTYSVTWWDPHALHLDATLPSGIRRPELITKEAAPEMVDASLAAYRSWRASRDAAVDGASQPTLRVHPATTWAARSDVPPPAGPAAELEVVRVDLPPGRPAGASFGSLVHSVLSIVPLEAELDTIRQAAAVYGRILGASQHEVAAAPAVVARILAHPLLMRARNAPADAVRRELPITLVADSGELVEGFVDLAFDENGGTTLVDFKTDAEIAANLPKYARQLGAYGAALGRVTGRPIRLVLLAAGA